MPTARRRSRVGADQFMRRTLGLAIVGLFITGVAAGCGGSAGTQGAGSTGDQGSRTPPSSSPAPVNRPKQIKLDSVDPCSLLTPQQWQPFLITKPGKSQVNQAFHGQECFYTDAIGGAFRVTLVTNDSAASWSNGSHSGQTQTIDAIDGFPTVVNSRPAEPNRCDAIVDTGDSEYLLATVNILPNAQSQFPDHCQTARSLAAASLETLLASH